MTHCQTYWNHMSYVCQCSDLWSLQINIQYLVESAKFFEDLRSNSDARSWDVVRPGANASWATVITETVEIQEFGIKMNSNVLTSGRFQSVELPPPQQRNIMICILRRKLSYICTWNQWSNQLASHIWSNLHIIIYFLLFRSTTKRNTCNSHTTCDEDGYFQEAECSGDFCQCWNGWGWRMSCMEPLKFDENLPGTKAISNFKL